MAAEQGIRLRVAPFSFTLPFHAPRAALSQTRFWLLQSVVYTALAWDRKQKGRAVISDGRGVAISKSLKNYIIGVTVRLRLICDRWEWLLVKLCGAEKKVWLNYYRASSSWNESMHHSKETQNGIKGTRKCYMEMDAWMDGCKAQQVIGDDQAQRCQGSVTLRV